MSYANSSHENLRCSIVSQIMRDGWENLCDINIKLFIDTSNKPVTSDVVKFYFGTDKVICKGPGRFLIINPTEHENELIVCNSSWVISLALNNQILVYTVFLIWLVRGDSVYWKEKNVLKKASIKDSEILEMFIYARDNSLIPITNNHVEYKLNLTSLNQIEKSKY